MARHQVGLRPASDDQALSGEPSIHTYATYLLVAQQASAVLQWAIKKELKIARAHAYEATIESRGKDKSFWIPYVEEWKIPPVERAQRSLERKGFLMKADNPWLKLILLRCKPDLHMLDFA